MADIQINATGGDVTEQTSIQIRRGSTATDSPPVEEGVEQFSAHEREELTESWSFAGATPDRPVVGIRGSITLRGSCYAYLRNGTLVFGGLDRRSFSIILGGLGVFSDSDVRHFL